MRIPSRAVALIAIVVLAFAGAAWAEPRAPEGLEDVLWSIDNPRDGDVVTGLVWVRGWVLSYEGVSNIDLYVDDEMVGSADHDLPRIDLNEIYPQYQGTPGENPGFNVGFMTDDWEDGEVLSLFLRITLSTGAGFDTEPVSLTVDHTLNQHPFGGIDLPKADEGLTGAFPVVGWALDGDGFVTQVDVLLDGAVKHGAVVGDYRPDVSNAFGMVPGSAGAGFMLWLDSNDMTPGIHYVSVRLTDNEGAARVLGPRRIQTFNNAVNQPPFGKIDVPLYNATWHCSQCVQGFSCPVSPCAQFEVLEDIYFVSGWALDTDSAGEPKKEGSVAWVELYVDGARFWNTRTDCAYLASNFPWVPEPLDDHYVNCYGLFRPDVNMLFPGFAHAKDAGFLFIIDVCNQLIFDNYVPGLHFVSVRAGDVDEQAAVIDTKPILLTCPATDYDYAAIGYIDFPTDYEFVNGVVQYVGWAMDRDLTEVVTIWVDGTPMGNAQYGIERPDVPEQYPNYPLSLSEYSGFVYYLDTTLLSDGEHDTYVIVSDRWGEDTILGQRRIVVDNNVN